MQLMGKRVLILQLVVQILQPLHLLAAVMAFRMAVVQETVEVAAAVRQAQELVVQERQDKVMREVLEALEAHQVQREAVVRVQLVAMEMVMELAATAQLVLHLQQRVQR